MVARLILVLVHTPPLTEFDRVVVVPSQTDNVPVIGPGPVLMAMVWVATVVPQALVTLYFMVSIPREIALTNPAEPTVQVLLLLLHIPPVTDSVSVVVAPVQSAEAPKMVPALGRGLMLTVTTIVLISVLSEIWMVK